MDKKTDPKKEMNEAEKAEAEAAAAEALRRINDTNYNPLLSNGITNKDVSVPLKIPDSFHRYSEPFVSTSGPTTSSQSTKWPYSSKTCSSAPSTLSMTWKLNKDSKTP